MISHNDDWEALNFIRPTWDRGPWIAGGAVLAWYNNETVSTDIDVYFRNQLEFDRLHHKFKEDKVEGTNPLVPVGFFTFSKPKNKDVRIVHESDNAITIRYKEKWTIQLIRHTFYKTPHDIIDNFDISVCQLVTDGHNKIVFGDHTLPDIKSNTLRMVKYRPGCVSRLVKYMAYGYRPIDGTLENIINVPDLDENFKVGFEEYDY